MATVLPIAGDVYEVVEDEVYEVVEDGELVELDEEDFEEEEAEQDPEEIARKAAIEAARDVHRVYRGFGAAKALWACRDEEILMEGPAGTGKTRAILEKVNFCAMKYPGARFLLVRKTRESMTESVLEIWENKVLPPGSPMLNGAKRNLRQKYYYPNGSEVVIGGIDKPGKIMSTEYDIIACFETTELNEDDFESLTTRLRNGVMPYSQIVADCNPDAPGHWLNKRPETKGMTRLLSRHEDNPRWYDHKARQWTKQGEAYIKKLDRLTGARKLRLRFGKWAAAEGAVYENFDAAFHVINHRLVPKHWRKIRSIDFGFTNPFVCQWWAIDDDGRMYLYRELYHTKRLVRDMGLLIGRLSKGENIEATVCDWDAEDRATLEEVGITTTPAYKYIQPGLQAVAARLEKQEDGKARIYFMRDTLVETDSLLSDEAKTFCTLHEIDNYHYPKGQDGKPLKEEPVKKDDHGMDAMRYAVAYVDNLNGMVLSVMAEEAISVAA